MRLKAPRVKCFLLRRVLFSLLIANLHDSDIAERQFTGQMALARVLLPDVLYSIFIVKLQELDAFESSAC